MENYYSILNLNFFILLKEEKKRLWKPLTYIFDVSSFADFIIKQGFVNVLFIIRN